MSGVYIPDTSNIHQRLESIKTSKEHEWEEGNVGRVLNKQVPRAVMIPPRTLFPFDVLMWECILWSSGQWGWKGKKLEL